MSDGIQRYAFDAFGPAHPGGVIIHADDGPYVTYEDHLAAVAEAQRISSKVIADFQQQAREAALREALEAVRGLIHSAQCDCESCFWLAPAPDAIQHLIDGGSE